MSASKAPTATQPFSKTHIVTLEPGYYSIVHMGFQGPRHDHGALRLPLVILTSLDDTVRLMADGRGLDHLILRETNDSALVTVAAPGGSMLIVLLNAPEATEPGVRFGLLPLEVPRVAGTAGAAQKPAGPTPGDPPLASPPPAPVPTPASAAAPVLTPVSPAPVPPPVPKLEPPAPVPPPTPVTPPMMSADRLTPSARSADPTPDFDILAHCEGVGDVTVPAHAWAGEPGQTRRVEGFALAWRRPLPGLDLTYAAAGPGDDALHFVSAPQFVGSQGQARPITRLAFALAGPHADGFDVTYQCDFAGGASRLLANGEEASGPTGAEALVAFRVAITPKVTAPIVVLPPDEPAGHVVLHGIGHSAQVGDHGDDQGWLGQVGTRLPLEGFTLDPASLPADVVLEGRAKVPGQPLGDWIPAGGFLGTRGQARPITDVCFRLKGPGAAAWTLTYEGVFDGGFSVGPVAAGQWCGGPTGIEPLIATRLVLSRA